MPAIIKLYRHLPTSEELRHAVATALSDCVVPEAEPFLREMLWDESLGESIRAHVAGALIKLDRDVGRDAILAFYDLELARSRSEGQASGVKARGVMETLSDAKLMSQLEEKGRREPPGGIRNNILTLLRTMRINTLPLPEVVRLAEDNEWKVSNSDRWNAIERLGRDGTAEHIPILTSLPLYGDGPNDVQRDTFRMVVNEAVAGIRRRHWQDPRTKPAAKSPD
jgi:hypothetical protein